MLLLDSGETTAYNDGRNEGRQVGIGADNLLGDCWERTERRIQNYSFYFFLEHSVVVWIDFFQKLEAGGSSHWPAP